ncbi:hypothetical protein ABN028_16315 [Actinopolymorpha sp. B17G11]|uniref:hypothetical protein n=1 Tax=Actinopolymorpha sp. B17G11 TaxID=3160861 RepID=UPI0032E51FC9
MRTSDALRFFAVLTRCQPGLATVWWAVVVARGVLPAAFAVQLGALVDAVRHGRPLDGLLVGMGVTFVLLHLLAPLHTQVSANLGDHASSWLHDRLLVATTRPQGMPISSHPS